MDICKSNLCDRLAFYDQERVGPDNTPGQLHAYFSLDILFELFIAMVNSIEDILVLNSKYIVSIIFFNMVNISKFLDLIEYRIRSLMEKKLNAIFNRRTSNLIIEDVFRLIQETSFEIQPGKVMAPDIYNFFVPVEDYDLWLEKQPSLEEILMQIYHNSETSGIYFPSYPKIFIFRADDPFQRDLKITASFTPKEEEMTATTLLKLGESKPEEILPLNAFLIINGTLTFPLNQPIISIGRRSTSDLSLNDSLVSRDHLQLRAKNGKFLLFDLDSLGGTMVNNKKCNSAILESGDMITIGNTTLLYGEDMPDLSFRTSILPEL